jgi:hypothetical protein
MIARAILSAFLLLSAVLCQFIEEDYVDVNCQYHWGGTVCECENASVNCQLFHMFTLIFT